MYYPKQVMHSHHYPQLFLELQLYTTYKSADTQLFLLRYCLGNLALLLVLEHWQNTEELHPANIAMYI